MEHDDVIMHNQNHNHDDDSDINDDDEAAVLDDGKLVCPGDCVLRDAHAYMRGKGTYPLSSGLYSSLPGLVTAVNKLVTVRPTGNTRYAGDVGDVVVGRIAELQQKRWKVDVGGPLHALLALSAVNLPGGELRRKSLADELAMRQYLREGDLVSAEVQQVYRDGMLALHTRSLKYGRLAKGTLVRVPSSLVKRRRTHLLSLAGNVSAIVGCNGFVWIAPQQESGAGANADAEYDPADEQQQQQQQQHVDTGGYGDDLSQPVDPSTRRNVSRVRNCVCLLADARLPIYDTSITFAYDAGAVYETMELLRPSVAAAVADQVRRRIASEQA